MHARFVVVVFCFLRIVCSLLFLSWDIIINGNRVVHDDDAIRKIKKEYARDICLYLINLQSFNHISNIEMSLTVVRFSWPCVDMTEEKEAK